MPLNFSIEIALRDSATCKGGCNATGFNSSPFSDGWLHQIIQYVPGMPQYEDDVAESILDP